MVKKLISLITTVLAINFLVAAGGIGYLVMTGKMDREKVQAIRELVFASNDPSTTQPTSQPTAQDLPPMTPMLRMEELLAQVSGRPENEKASAIQTVFDSQSIILERRFREIEDQRRQLAQAKADFEIQRKKLIAETEALKTTQAAQSKQAEDKGFQDTLALYQSMPAKKTKEIFKSLDDDTVVRYLQAMEPRIAGGILKEFKTPEENNRAQAILEKMRLANVKAE